MSWKYNAGIELHQVKSGMKGRLLGIGGYITEDPKDIKAEMREVWKTMRDDKQYETFRTNVRELRNVIVESAERGESKQAFDQIVDTYLSPQS